MSFKIVDPFSSYDDGSGASMTFSHPYAGTINIGFVKGEVRSYGISPAKCFGNRARGQFNWAVKKMKEQFWTHIEALGPEWMDKHKEIYEID